MVNFIKSWRLNSILFQILRKEMGAEHKSLLLRTEVCWLSCRKVLGCFYKLREEVIKFISANKSEINPWIDDKMWWVKLTYLTHIFGHLNLLNTNMQGRNETLLTTTDKLYGFLLRLSCGKQASHKMCSRCSLLRKLLREL